MHACIPMGIVLNYIFCFWEAFIPVKVFVVLKFEMEKAMCNTIC